MARAKQADKEALLAGLATAREAALKAAAEIGPARWRAPFLGTWSMRELLAHLAGWDSANLQAAEAIQLGNLPDFYQYHDADWRRYNALLVQQYGRESLEDQLAVVTAARVALMAYLEGVPAEAFDHDYGVRFRGYKVTISRLLAAEASDERVHAGQILAFAAAPADKGEG